MKHIFTHITLPTVALILCLSCSKEKDQKKEGPVITIATPANNQHFTTGNTIHITGNVTDNTGINSVAVHMTDINTNNEFFHYHLLANNATTYSYDAPYTISSSGATAYRVEVEAEDIDGNDVTKELMITIN